MRFNPPSICTQMQRAASAFCALLTIAPAFADVRVQDIARLQGQRTNRLMGYGLVVGLPGTGDGEKYLATMRALMRLHERFHAPVITEAELKGNKSVALVAVEASIPEFGAREGQAIDVTVSAVGSAKSLRGGQLLVTPLQYAMFDESDPQTQRILALAAGRVSLPNAEELTRGIISRGATLEEDCIYSFIQDGLITLVLDDAHAGWTWAQLAARSINHELAGASAITSADGDDALIEMTDAAVALDPKNVVVKIPSYELANPAGFISRVLQSPLFTLPAQAARVTINRASRTVSFTGAVRVSPTSLTVAGLGSLTIGSPAAPKPDDPNAPKAAEPPARKSRAAAPTPPPPVPFSEFMNALTAAKATPEQIIDAIESLHRCGALHAELRYE